MKHVKEELEEQIETLTKELELASVKSRSLILPEQTQQSAELISKVERLEMQLKEAMESEVAQRNSTRDLERQVEVESNNSRLVQDQYSSLKQMYDDLKKSYHLVVSSMETPAERDDAEEQLRT